MTVEQRRSSRSGLRDMLLVIATITVLGILVWVFVPRGKTIADAEKLFRLDRLEQAERLALQLAEHPELKASGLSIAYRAALQLKRFDDAIGYVENMPDASEEFQRYVVDASDLAVYSLHQFQRAEILLERVAKTDSDNVEIIERRAFLFGLTGRSQKAEPLRLELVRRGVRAWTMLWLLCLGDDALENTELLAEIDEGETDPMSLFAVSRWVSDRGDAAKASKLLERAIELGAPVEAVVTAGRLAREAGDETKLLRMLVRSASVSDSALLWWLRGVWCEQHGKLNEAIRCHAEAVRLQTNLSRSLIPLARLLEAEGNQVLANLLRERASNLALYLNAVKAVRQESKRQQWESVLALTRTLSMNTEAAGWWTMGRPEWQQEESTKEIREWLEAHRSQPGEGRVLPQSHPLNNFDLSEWPLPDFDSRETEVVPHGERDEQTRITNSKLQNPERGTNRWEEVATATGLDFVFQPFPGSTSAGPRMFEFTGGGVAVVDFDCDGFLDTWWTQGIHWPADQTCPPSPSSTDLVDQLFRNERGDRWRNVTTVADARETGFGQGVAAGDLDGDGFSEIVVANIGTTVVHWNKGDGTFKTEQLPIPPGWSTSVAIADLNSDSLPDIFVVRYLGGPEIFTRTCPDSENHPHSCLPQHFPAEPDLFLRNMGNGQFVDETRLLGFDESNGKGLGIVIADFSGDGSLDVFVANDTTPNSCWVRQTAGDQPSFLDEGLLNGLALNADGRAQADMGIAIDDADGNGLFDVFVTKFLNETNTLSLQVHPGLFVDSTSGTGLGDSSLHVLGFGVRFVDADLDGRPDIAVTNGHIDDVRHRGEPFEMLPQFYRNDGEGKFTELHADELGPFFSRASLGRGMAKGDWNHDGYEDLFISHIGSPAAVLQNASPGLESEARPCWVSIELTGMKGVRNPIGATIEVSVAGEKYVKVLAAGNGYLSCDSHRITFGLGTAQTIDDVLVTWPSGVAEQVDGINPMHRWSIIEGRGKGIMLP